MRALYILRGASGSGKSTWIQKNGYEPLAISLDAIRLAEAGLEFDVEGHPSISQRENDAVWKRAKELVEARMKQGLTTILVSTMIDLRNASRFRNLANDYRYRVYIVGFTKIGAELCKGRNYQRPDYKQVPEYVIERMCSRLKKGEVPKSIPVLTRFEAKRKLDEPELFEADDYSAINFIGDIHGCYTALMDLMKKLGGTSENDFIKEDELYVFLGDYVERGIENAQVVEYLMRIASKKNVRLLEGNHERYLSSWSKGDEVENPSFSIMKTQLEDSGIDKKEVRQFVRRLGQFVFYSFHGQKIFACHGGISRIPHPFAYLSSKDLIYGFGSYKDVGDMEEVWETWSQENGEILVHGHRSDAESSIHPFSRVYCLEGSVEHGGDLRCVRFEGNDATTIEVQNTVFRKAPACVDFDVEKDMSLIVESLRENDCIIEKAYGVISSFNFSNKAFYKGIWDSQTIRARGLFINTETNKVKARSYDKFFNLGEREETSLKELRRKLQFPVDIYLKENGYLGICSSDGNGELFTASKSSTTSDHAKRLAMRLEEHLGERAAEFSNYLEQNDLSAVFEVIEPEDDPHIVEYFEPRLVMLALVRNDIRFEQLPYLEMQSVASRFGFDAKKLLATVRSFQEFCSWVNDLEDEDWVLGGKHIEGVVAEDSAGYMVKMKGAWYRKWKSVRGILKDIARRGRSSKVDTLAQHYGDADQIYEAAKEYGAERSKRRKTLKGLCPPPKAENVIMFRNWYENIFLRRQLRKALKSKGDPTFEIDLSQIINIMKEYPCWLFAHTEAIQKQVEASGLTYVEIKDEGDSGKSMLCIVNAKFPFTDFKKLMNRWCNEFNLKPVIRTWPIDRRETSTRVHACLIGSQNDSKMVEIDDFKLQNLEDFFAERLGQNARPERKVVVHQRYEYELYSFAGMVRGAMEFKTLYPELSDDSTNTGQA